MSKKILLISTGGTIAQTKDDEGTSVSKGDKKADAFATALENASQNLGIEKIDPLPVLDKDSSNIVPEDWGVIVRAILENYDLYDSFVITHGTNTLGYTSAALSFALGKLGKPVILTGSQVPFGYPGSDAAMNLENAIRVAAYDKGLAGVMAVFGSHIITGTRVKKTTEFEYDAFKSFNSSASIGRVGRILKINKDALEAHLSWIEPRARYAKELDVKCHFDMNIASLTEFPGMSSDIFKVLVNSKKVKGVIYRATGAGDPNIAKAGVQFDNLREGFEYLQEKRIPIVVTTQAPDGVASMDVNEPGMLAFELGAIPAWDMSMEAMTAKFGWLLGRGTKYEDMRSEMTRNMMGELVQSRG